MRKKNLTLKLTVVAHETTFYAISRQTEIHVTRLSQIANGIVKPRQDEMDRIAAALGVKPNDIFPEDVR